MSQPESLPQLVTIKDVMSSLKCSSRTVRRLAQKGELTPIYIGRAARFDASEIKTYIESRKLPYGNWERIYEG